MRSLPFLAAAAVLSCGLAAAAPSATPAGRPVLPKGGSLVGNSRFLTIRSVPASPTRDVRPQRQTYSNVTEWYAQEEGLTLAEAGKRLSEQQALQPVFERLRERLSKQEPDNYVDAALVHRPDWSYVLYFKRDPEGTLRKYSVNSRFRAAKAGYTNTELQALVAPWAKRFAEEGIAGGYGISPTEGRAEMMMSVTAAEYRTIAARNGWGEVPPPIRLGFAKDLGVARIDPRVAPLLRGFASESRATTIQLEAGGSGRVVLDDGCLRLAAKGRAKGPLVVFHRETGIGLDAQGFLAIIDRRTGKATGRVGEVWSWAGPNNGTDFDGLAELKAACGDGPVENVGNPESQARFRARHPGY